MNRDPFEIIVTGKFEQVPKGVNVYSEAISILNSDFQASKLETLLKADSELVVTDGLMILSEMGEKGCCLIDLALKHTGHKDWTARFYLADVLLACSEILGVNQISRALELCEDENVRVRCKTMEIISRLSIGDIKSAIIKIGSEHKQHFKTGISFLAAGEGALTQAKRSINSDSFVERCFAGGLILQLARAAPCELSVEASTDEEKYLSNKLQQICEYR